MNSRKENELFSQENIVELNDETLEQVVGGHGEHGSDNRHWDHEWRRWRGYDHERNQHYSHFHRGWFGHR